MEGALGHARKHLDHRIGSLLLIHVAELDYVRTIRKESAAQESIHEEYVTELKRKQY